MRVVKVLEQNQSEEWFELVRRAQRYIDRARAGLRLIRAPEHSLIYIVRPG